MGHGRGVARRIGNETKRNEGKRVRDGDGGNETTQEEGVGRRESDGASITIRLRVGTGKKGTWTCNETGR